MHDLISRHHGLRDTYSEPQPMQSPHPPIWIGGAGGRKTLRVVAGHADVGIWFEVIPPRRGDCSASWTSTSRMSVETRRMPGAAEEGFTETILTFRWFHTRRYAAVATYEGMLAIREAAPGLAPGSGTPA